MRHVVRRGLCTFAKARSGFATGTCCLRRTFMAYRLSVRFLSLVTLAMGILQTSAAPAPQQEVAVEPPPLDMPLMFDSSTRGSGGNKIPGPKFRVVPLRGLSYPYALAFLPDASILVTERAGRLRIGTDGKLDPQPIAGIPDVLNTRQRGMNDLAFLPHFAEADLDSFP